MTLPETVPPETGRPEPAPGAGPEPGDLRDDPDNPWHGIPAELLDPDRGYDTDTAGGCG